MQAEKTISLPERHKVVADCIRVGKENATLLSDIMIVADIQDRRNAYLIIEQLINDYGYVIGASKNGPFMGYYTPANEREFADIADTFRSSIESMDKRLFNLIKNYNQMIA